MYQLAFNNLVVPILKMFFKNLNQNSHTGHTFKKIPFLCFTVRFCTLLYVWHQARNAERTYI